MIITKQKPIEEIKEMLKDFKKIVIIGCSDYNNRNSEGGIQCDKFI